MFKKKKKNHEELMILIVEHWRGLLKGTTVLKHCIKNTKKSKTLHCFVFEGFGNLNKFDLQNIN